MLTVPGEANTSLYSMLCHAAVCMISAVWGASGQRQRERDIMLPLRSLLYILGFDVVFPHPGPIARQADECWYLKSCWGQIASLRGQHSRYCVHRYRYWVSDAWAPLRALCIMKLFKKQNSSMNQRDLTGDFCSWRMHRLS